MAIQNLLTNPFRPFQDTGISESVGRGLEALTQHKMQQMQQQKTVQALSLLGLPSQYAALDPRILQQVVHQKLQEPQQLAFAQGLQSLLGSGGEQQMQQQVPASNFASPSQSSNGEQVGRAIFGAPPMNEGERLGKAIFGNQPPGSAMPEKSATSQPRIPTGLNPQQAFQLAQIGLQKQAATRKERLMQEQLNKKESGKLQAQANKETKPYYDEVVRDDKAAQKIETDTNRMLHLIDKGKLPDPVLYKQLKDLEESATPLKSAGTFAGAGATAGALGGGALAGPPGAVVGGLLGSLAGGLAGLAFSQNATHKIGKVRKEFPDTEEFEKLSANFISGAKAVFGNRVTNQDLIFFMQTVPTLMNTENGKRAIIRNIKLASEATRARYKAMKEIIKDNNGHRPIDIAIQVEEKVTPQLDKLAQQFKEGFTENI